MLALAGRAAAGVALERCAGEGECLPRDPKIVIGGSGVSGGAFIDNAAFRDYAFRTFGARLLDMEERGRSPCRVGERCALHRRAQPVGPCRRQRAGEPAGGVLPPRGRQCRPRRQGPAPGNGGGLKPQSEGGPRAMRTLDISDCINETCPWSGKPVQADSLIEFDRRVVGLCNPGCRDKFETALRHFERAKAAKTGGRGCPEQVRA